MYMLTHIHAIVCVFVFERQAQAVGLELSLKKELQSAENELEKIKEKIILRVRSLMEVRILNSCDIFPNLEEETKIAQKNDNSPTCVRMCLCVCL